MVATAPGEKLLTDPYLGGYFCREGKGRKRRGSSSFALRRKRKVGVCALRRIVSRDPPRDELTVEREAENSEL